MTKSFPNSPAFAGPLPTSFEADYKQADYGKVILPFTLLRRLDCVLEPTRPPF